MNGETKKNWSQTEVRAAKVNKKTHVLIDLR